MGENVEAAEGGMFPGQILMVLFSHLNPHLFLALLK